MNSPFFSVIIPTFNRASFLERSIKSVLAQRFTDFELIVIDDGSTDDTEKMITSFGDNIHYYKTKNQGVSAARNFGVQKAKAKWICFLDSDDQWHEYKLSDTKKYSEENSQFKLIHSNEIWYRKGERVNQMKKHQKGGGDQFENSLDFCTISPSTVCMEKDIFLELGGFREDFEICEDYDLWLKFTSLFPVGFIEKPLINKYGGHEDQLSMKYFAMDEWRIKSLCWLLDNRSFSSDLYQKVKSVLLKKTNILLKGYDKHSRFLLAKDLKQRVEKYGPL